MLSPDSVQRFSIAVPDAAITDLHRRLDNCRWPDEELVGDTSQGVPLKTMRALAEYWRNNYDWRCCEAALNRHPQFVTQIDGVEIHFLHIRSRHANALPMILTHGWPGSIIEFMKVIDPLTDPERHGGTTDQAFHLVIPSVPGFGFSGKPRDTGWKVERIAAAWEVLMQRLGYDYYVAQGGDIGAAVTSYLGRRACPALVAIHTNQPFVLPPPPYENLLPDQQRMMDALALMGQEGAGYAVIQSTRPQTLGYGLSDSPIGQAAWIYEKFAAWSDCGGVAENILTRDELLDNIMVYWLTGTATSSARFYWDNNGDAIRGIEINVPACVTIFPGEIYPAARSWAEQYMSTIAYWEDAERGGHFPAFEQPAIFVREMRNCFAPFRQGTKRGDVIAPSGSSLD